MQQLLSITHLKAGMKAPEFSAYDQYGVLCALKDYKGKKVAICFYPNDDTETCTKEMCNLRDNYTSLQKKGYDIIAVSHAPIESKKKFSDKYALPFRLLADTNQKIVIAYGVYGSKLFMGKTIETIHRLIFVVNEKGYIEKIIHKVWSGKATDQIIDKSN